MKFPDDTQRHAIYGQTGTGKTTFALWCLSRRSWHRMPWVIIDSKLDPGIAQIPRLEEIDINGKPPKKKGLYVVRPMPGDFDDGHVSSWLMRVWSQEHTGIFIDEGYSFRPQDRALRAILTQGRSKRIPVIALAQRPAWVSPYIHSESEYKTAFYLQTPADIDRMREWFPPGYDNENLPDHYSYWYGRPGREFVRFGPCPPEDEIMQVFDDRGVRRVFI